ncbi:MAG: hypothetical protein IPO73_14705 [Gemmatimonadetes bacterium]|nr:hypothetical protein [Gemmatimonadota bacterium]
MRHAILFVLFCPGLLAAQAADSAQAARAHLRAANAALRAGDTAAALGAAELAVRAWPTQVAYRLTLARFAARAGRAELAFRELDTVIALGAGWTDRDPLHAALAGAPGYAALQARMQAGVAPLARSRVQATLPDTLFHPEGIAWDGARQRFLVSSIRRRQVVAVDLQGRTVPFLRPGQDGLDAVIGLGVDSMAGVLWLASRALPNQEGYTAADAGRSALYAYDLATGTLQRRVDAAGAGLGDLTLGPDGTVYLSDDVGQAIHRLRPGAPALEAVIRGDPLLRSPQGLALAPDGARLYVADWSHGLQVVDLASGRVRTVPLDGVGTLLGLDGLVLAAPGRLVALQNGLAPPRVVALTLDAAGERVARLEVLDRHLPLATEPTLGVLTGGALVYVANSPWANYDDAGAPLPGTGWPPPILLRLPLRPQ